MWWFQVKKIHLNLISHEHNYSQNVPFRNIIFCTTMPVTRSYWNSFNSDNGWVTSIIGLDTVNKLKCVPLSNGTVSWNVSDMAINVCEQLVLKIKESDYFALPMDRPTQMCWEVGVLRPIYSEIPTNNSIWFGKN